LVRASRVGKTTAVATVVADHRLGIVEGAGEGDVAVGAVDHALAGGVGHDDPPIVVVELAQQSIQVTGTGAQVGIGVEQRVGRSETIYWTWARLGQRRLDDLLGLARRVEVKGVVTCRGHALGRGGQPQWTAE
jgi:hypothetical protein